MDYTYIWARQIQSTPPYSVAFRSIGGRVAQSISLLLHFFGWTGFGYRQGLMILPSSWPAFCLWTRLASPDRYGAMFLQEHNLCCMTLATYLHLVPRLRISGDLSPLLQTLLRRVAWRSTETNLWITFYWFSWHVNDVVIGKYLTVRRYEASLVMAEKTPGWHLENKNSVSWIMITVTRQVMYI